MVLPLWQIGIIILGFVAAIGISLIALMIRFTSIEDEED